MVSGSKILTVSYGTFSCTLEGFDDSFDTMKAIAEYFRDLAADDRYFGAEPPTPDAEMLARIAEREIARRVEAHEREGNIVLRASDAQALAGLAATPAASDKVPAEGEVQQEADAPPKDAAAEEDTAPATGTEAPESRAETAAADRDSPETGSDEGAPTPAMDAAPEEMPQQAPSDAAPEPDTAETEALADVAEAEERAETADSEAADQPQETDRPADAAPAEEAPAAEDAAEAPEATEVPDTAEAPAEADAAPKDSQDTAAEDQPDAADASTTEPIAADESTAPEPAELDDLPAPQADAAAPSEAQAEDEDDSIAAKLRRIRSVVLNAEASDAANMFTEDEHAEDTGTQDFLDSTVANLDAALAEDDAAETAEAAHEPGLGGEDDFDSILSRFDAEIVDDEDAQPIETEREVTDTVAAQDDAPEDVPLDRDTLAQLMADALPETDEGDSAEPLRLGPDDAVESDRAEGEAPEADSGEPAEIRARVVTIKRSEFEAAVAEGQFEQQTDAPEAEDQAHEPENVVPSDDTIVDDASPENVAAGAGLSPEDEADLQRELAELEAEMGLRHPSESGAPEADDTEEAEDSAIEIAAGAEDVSDTEEDSVADQPADPGPSPRQKLEGMGDAPEVSRIFEEADNQREEPESNRRRSVIQHLRAAVAATRAEKKPASDAAGEQQKEPYRSDLANVVRPRRPSADGSSARARSARPESARPAPLKLVAEQRIDMEHPRDPVRPRRVSASDLEAEATASSAPRDTGFADYARQVGASDLTELLEAAAAYLSDVEGRPQFSRPMLMGKLREVDETGFSREDGLRSFGKLLRQGKLQKLKGGRFTVTEDTEFRTAQARSAG